MKLSRFNIWERVNDELILFNAASNALVTFDRDYSDLIDDALKKSQVNQIPVEFRSDLSTDGFLVEEDCDEIAAIHEAARSRATFNDHYFLSVVTNFACNFDCGYCFEKITGEMMPERTEGKIETMVAKIAKKASRIEVDWFGGEPTLSFGLVKRLNDRFISICRENDVEYAAAITTNGYLLTEKWADYCAASSIGRIMTTIDGPADLHDKSRPLRNGKGTLTRILSNMQYAVAKGLNVSVRVNVSKTNGDRLIEVFDMLEGIGLKNKVEVILQPVVSSSAKPCEEICLEGSLLAGKVMPAYIQAAKQGWVIFPNIGKLRSLGFCIAEYPGRFIIDLQGNLYKCAQLFTEKEKVGTIDSNGGISLNHTRNSTWVDKDPTTFKECCECALLPVCMGGCNLKRHWKPGSDYCIDVKYGLPGFLEAMVLNQSNLESRTD